MISTVVRTVLVYCAVTVAMRLMGKRQLGELPAGRACDDIADLQCGIDLH